MGSFSPSDQPLAHAKCSWIASYSGVEWRHWRSDCINANYDRQIHDCPVYSLVSSGGLTGVTIERVIVKNYRKLRCTNIELLPDLNIIVGDNESGKSTLLEAINLALKGQINRRPAQYELHPFLFSTECVAEFIENQKNGKKGKPPEILIELYFAEHPSLADLKGTINSLKED